MNTDEIHEIVLEVFQAVFSSISIDKSLTLKQAECVYWDSMAHIALISALEGEFDVAMSLEEAASIKSFEECVNVIASLVSS